MVKIRTIVRVPSEEMRETKRDLYKYHKNTDPNLHPLQKAREYKRAVNAAKLERMFSKPFVTSLSSHTDSVYSMSRSDKFLTLLVSGSCNGEIKLWDLSSFKSKLDIVAHTGFVTGLSFRGENFISTGRDQLVKIWNLKGKNDTFNSSMGLTGVDMSWDSPLFVTSGQEGVDLWDTKRSFPITRFEWGSDTILKSRFNPSESSLVGGVGNDRSILLIDVRANSCISKTITAMKSNDLMWNPREPMIFSVANEDGNMYTFDMRDLSTSVKIFKGHVGSVTSLAYSPTGREIASGSFDRTVRIFDIRNGNQRDVYHTRRMQWIYSVEFSGDGNFVMTGSDDTNLRVWKAKAHKPLKQLLPREEEAINYREKLKKNYQYVPEVRRLLKHRHLPRFLRREQKKKQIMKESKFRKEQNRMAHTRPEKIKKVSEKKKVIVDNPN